MLKHLCIAVAIALLSSVGSAQTVTATKIETLKSLTFPLFTADVEAINYAVAPPVGVITTVQYEARVLGFSFGLSPLFGFERGEDDPVFYESFGLFHNLLLDQGISWNVYTESSTPGLCSYITAEVNP